MYRGLHGKKRVAVKIVHHLAKRLQTGNNPSEPVLMQAVSHPNLLKVFEWKLAENARKEERLWLILELCDGGDIAVGQHSSVRHYIFERSIVVGVEEGIVVALDWSDW